MRQGDFHFIVSFSSLPLNKFRNEEQKKKKKEQKKEKKKEKYEQAPYSVWDI